MFKEHARIMNAIAASGEIAGRKKLQKIIYIAKKLSFPFQEKFEFHFYGPYSEELTLRIEELCNMGYLHEVKERKQDITNTAILLPKPEKDLWICTKSTCRSLKIVCLI